MPQTAIESYVKSLRRAGLIISGPRGTAAPDIPANQVARCLIAILSGSPAHAVERVSYYGNLVSHFSPPKDEMAFMASFDLDPSHSFLEMLTKHIEFYSDGTFFQRGVKAVIEAKIYHSDYLNEALRQFEIKSDDQFQEITNASFIDLYEPTSGAAITLSTCLFGAGEMVEDIRIYYAPPRFYKPTLEYEEPFPIKKGDLEHRSRITDHTLMMLGDLLH